MRIPLLALFVVLALPGFAQPGGVTLDIGADTASFGQTATIPVQIDVTGPEPSIVVFHVGYDPIKLAYQGFDRGSIIPADKLVADDVGTTGISFVIYGGTSQIPTGRLLTLRFTVITPVMGAIAINGENGSASTPQGSGIDVTIEDGAVTVSGGSTGLSCAAYPAAGLTSGTDPSPRVSTDILMVAGVCFALAAWRTRRSVARQHRT